MALKHAGMQANAKGILCLLSASTKHPLSIRDPTVILLAKSTILSSATYHHHDPSNSLAAGWMNGWMDGLIAVQSG